MDLKLAILGGTAFLLLVLFVWEKLQHRDTKRELEAVEETLKYAYARIERAEGRLMAGYGKKDREAEDRSLGVTRLGPGISAGRRSADTTRSLRPSPAPSPHYSSPAPSSSFDPFTYSMMASADSDSTSRSRSSDCGSSSSSSYSSYDSSSSSSDSSSSSCDSSSSSSD